MSTARRASGAAPYWPAGAQIMWREGSGPLGTGALVADTSLPHFAQPVTVVSDDADALVVWLPVGTPVQRLVRADGREKRSDPATLFTADVVAEEAVHALFDQVRIVPTGQPWSVWAMFSDGVFSSSYVNLESPHVRDALGVYTSDRVLDVVVSPDRSVALKDQDELVLAVSQGVFSAAEAAAIEADAVSVLALVAEWGSPFCDGWEKFRPDPDWPIPALGSVGLHDG